MDTTSSRRRLRPAACAVRLTLPWLAVLILLAGPGCSDHRTPLSRFLAQQTSPPDRGLPVAATQPAATQPAANAAAVDQFMAPYRVGPGDVLSVVIAGIEQTAGAAPIQIRIDREGEADLPLVGRVHLADTELQDVEKAIQKAYVPSVYRQASVHVELLKPEMVTVLVTGAVSQPGLVQLPRTQRNLLYAITGAGGASNTASGQVCLRRLRNPDQTFTIDILQPDQLQQALTMEPLQNGDVVLVQAAQPNTVFVGGLVNAPHAQVNPAGTEMNVLQAIASAAGLRTDVTPTEMTLIRRMPDGKDMHVKLDVDRIQKGKDPNLTLAPGDILWVPDTALTRVQDWVNRNIFFRAGFSVVGTYSYEGVNYLNNNAKRSALGNNNIQNTIDPLGFLTQQQSNNQNLPPPQ